MSQTEWFFNKEYLFDEKVMIAYHNLMHNTIQAFNLDNKNITSRIDKIFELERKFAFVIQKINIPNINQKYLILFFFF